MCPISFNIFGIKKNEVNFSSGTVIIHFLDKPYQEINFKSTTLLIRKITVRFAHVPCDFISLYLFALTFAMKLKSANYKSH